MQALEISLSGMDVEWRRLEVIANNLANAGTIYTAGGDRFRPMRLISGPRTSFTQHLQGASGRAGPEGATSGVAVYGEEPVDLPPRRVYEPSNPQADSSGYVTYPGVDQAGEMTQLLKTSRAYESNVVAMNIARQMYAKALELGR